MRLGIILRVSWPLKKKTPGRTYSGKNARVKPLKTCFKYSAVNSLMMEEQNMKYLQNPYITRQEETTYGQQHPKKQQRWEEFLEKRQTKFFPNRTLEDHFHNTARLNKKWE